MAQATGAAATPEIPARLDAIERAAGSCLFVKRSRPIASVVHLGALLAASATLGCAAGVSVVREDLSPGAHEMEVDGHALRFHVAGHGPPCIVHPGGPGAEWTYMRMPESERVLTLVYLEPVGTGRSGRLASPNDYSYERYAADVDALRVHLGLERVCLIGHSHGGLVALRYAIDHGDHLSGLVLYGTAAALDDVFTREMREHQRWFEGRAWYAAARASFGDFWNARTDAEMTRAFARVVPMWFADWDTLDPRVRERILQLHLYAGPARYRGPRFDVRAQLSTIHVPTMVIVGARDFQMSGTTAERLHHGIAGSSLVVLDHAGHMAHLEQPAAFARALAELARRLAHARDPRE